MPVYDVVVRAEEHVSVVAFSVKEARAFVRDSIEEGVLDMEPRVVSVVERDLAGGSDG